jgi:hypothetical protein
MSSDNLKGDKNDKSKSHARVMLRTNGGNGGKWWLDSDDELLCRDRKGDETVGSAGNMFEVSGEKKISRKPEEEKTFERKLIKQDCNNCQMQKGRNPSKVYCANGC